MATNWSTSQRQSVRVHVHGVDVCVRTRTYVEFTREANRPVLLESCCSRRSLTSVIASWWCELLPAALEAVQVLAGILKHRAGVWLETAKCHVKTGVHHRSCIWCCSHKEMETSDVALVVTTFYTGDHVICSVQSYIAIYTCVIAGAISAFNVRNKLFRMYEYNMCILLNNVRNKWFRTYEYNYDVHSDK